MFTKNKETNSKPVLLVDTSSCDIVAIFPSLTNASETVGLGEAKHLHQRLDKPFFNTTYMFTYLNGQTVEWLDIKEKALELCAENKCQGRIIDLVSWAEVQHEVIEFTNKRTEAKELRESLILDLDKAVESVESDISHVSKSVIQSVDSVNKLTLKVPVRAVKSIKNGIVTLNCELGRIDNGWVYLKV
jgi:hypothetical protein